MALRALFPPASAGYAGSMIGAALALIVLGIIFLFIIPWVGIPIGIVGIILLLLFLLDFARRAAIGHP